MWQTRAASEPHPCCPLSFLGGECRVSASQAPSPPLLQIEMLSPFEAVASRFKEQYKTFATALDTTRHELPMRSIHLKDGDGQRLLGRKWAGQGVGQTAHCVLLSPVCWAPLSLGVMSQASSQVDGVSPIKWPRTWGAGMAAVCPGWCPE